MVFKLDKKNQKNQSGELSENKLLKEKYRMWRSVQTDSKSPFFMMFKDLEFYWEDLTAGALKFYIYLGFRSKNETGESWYATETMAADLQVTTRTINNWINELLEKQMIQRTHVKGNSKTTYLLPLSKSLEKFEMQVSEFCNRIETEVFKKIYGEHTKTLILGQMRKNNKTSKYDEQYKIIVFVLDRNNGFENDISFHVNEIHDQSCSIKEEWKNITQQMIKVNVDYSLEKSKEKVDMYIINSKFNLKENVKLMEILEELTNEDTDVEKYQFINKTE